MTFPWKFPVQFPAEPSVNTNGVFGVYVIPSDAPIKILEYANKLKLAGFPVWVCDGVSFME
jgi:hypothetical protein